MYNTEDIIDKIKEAKCNEELTNVLIPLISKANAWENIDSFIRDNKRNKGFNIRNEVSTKLFNDGCYSSSTHAIEFIKELIERADPFNY